MRSVTEQAALDEFLSTAELAGTDFTAEKMNNVKIIHTDQKNPYLLSAAEERAAVGKQKAHKDRLTVPRRPQWDSTTTPEQLDRMERDSLLEWRRGLAELQENNDLLMTPFERNLEVWRQLLRGLIWWSKLWMLETLCCSGRMIWRSTSRMLTLERRICFWLIRQTC